MNSLLAASVALTIIGSFVLACLAAHYLWREWSPWYSGVRRLNLRAASYDLECPRERRERFSAWERRLSGRVEEVREAQQAFVDAAGREGRLFWSGPRTGYLALPPWHPAAVRLALARGIAVPKKYLN